MERNKVFHCGLYNLHRFLCSKNPQMLKQVPQACHFDYAIMIQSHNSFHTFKNVSVFVITLTFAIKLFCRYLLTFFCVTGTVIWFEIEVMKKITTKSPCLQGSPPLISYPSLQPLQQHRYTGQLTPLSMLCHSELTLVTSNFPTLHMRKFRRQIAKSLYSIRKPWV